MYALKICGKNRVFPENVPTNFCRQEYQICIVLGIFRISNQLFGQISGLHLEVGDFRSGWSLARFHSDKSALSISVQKLRLEWRPVLRKSRNTLTELILGLSSIFPGKSGRTAPTSKTVR